LIDRAFLEAKKAMTNENEHIKTLEAARDSLVTERRDLAVALSKSSRRGHSEETQAQFISLQSAIAAVEDAITHERQLAGPG
jgi:hypothetical protein